LEDTQTQFDEALETTTMFETELESRNKKVDELTKKSEGALEKCAQGEAVFAQEKQDLEKQITDLTSEKLNLERSGSDS